MAEGSPKKPWSKPVVRRLGSVDELRKALATGGREDLTPEEREAIRKLLPEQ
jgi:hypothetical protein